ncbi:Vacuolar protein-sorting-associated protein 27 [Mycoemilia scoparia]|uniref:Vacuolar protein sorting-associated protein 27 n=1 Tax=Mycoemilia scoparia TaxID=417184 RepID=A0A9W8DXH7_9FUNG|nr:Vacuolar protein-sorting-associated protein 27 [Mycoemilia scoparia]
MSFLFSSSTPKEIETLTDENIPGHTLNLSQALDLADKVRSKEYTVKDVARGLKERISHDNPNVQILALNLTDVVIKNGGDLFLVEVSSKDFVDNITNIVRHSGYSYELQKELLRLIQEWATLCSGNPELAYMTNAYTQLTREGYSFPKATTVSRALIETHAAPEWTDSDVCMRCRTPFTFTNRKHHCRNCGNCFCQTCSENTLPIPKFAIYDPVRVCHGCYLRLKNIVSIDDSQKHSSRSGTATASKKKPTPSPNLYTPQKKSTSIQTPSTLEDEDADLKRAIELSLKESKLYEATHTPANVVASNNEPHPLPLQNDDDEEDDPDMKAAIEASLREMSISRSPEQNYPNISQPTPPESESIHNFMPSNTNLDTQPHGVEDQDRDEDNPLTTIEQENVNLFESLLQRIKESGQDISNDQQIQFLHESISDLQPKVNAAIDRVDGKHQQLSQLLKRIGTATKIYDQLLEQRLSFAKLPGSTAQQSSRIDSPERPPSTAYSYHNIQPQVSQPYNPPTSATPGFNITPQQTFAAQQPPAVPPQQQSQLYDQGYSHPPDQQYYEQPAPSNYHQPYPPTTQQNHVPPAPDPNINYQQPHPQLQPPQNPSVVGNHASPAITSQSLVPSIPPLMPTSKTASGQPNQEAPQNGQKKEEEEEEQLLIEL